MSNTTPERTFHRETIDKLSLFEKVIAQELIDAGKWRIIEAGDSKPEKDMGRDRAC